MEGSSAMGHFGGRVAGRRLRPLPAVCQMLPGEPIDMAKHDTASVTNPLFSLQKSDLWTGKFF